MRRLVPRCLLVAMLATATANSASPEARADAIAENVTPDATLSLTGHLLAAGIGYKWGRGTLNYQGEQLRFCIRGLSIGDIGIARLEAEGAVFNLSSIDDFEGHYFAISTGAALAKGEAVALLKNDRGVVIELESSMKGLRFSLAATRLRITLASQGRCGDSH